MRAWRSRFRKRGAGAGAMTDQPAIGVTVVACEKTRGAHSHEDAAGSMRLRDDARQRNGTSAAAGLLNEGLLQMSSSSIPCLPQTSARNAVCTFGNFPEEAQPRSIFSYNETKAKNLHCLFHSRCSFSLCEIPCNAADLAARSPHPCNRYIRYRVEISGSRQVMNQASSCRVSANCRAL